ncbi:hypothetical protein MBAV_002478 [Candidatus Magnetobacterium bavaricum]|uniref:Uncharacterized protein n=1 Tax=Candidatus Magnetobacterium bavaricum TaxID=29290 RepID=A0A0F3GXC1_9BACT|nr:hypothetical protein MBAV_002478 [Candidatus Magnetobacterium bavaricum]
MGRIYPTFRTPLRKFLNFPLDLTFRTPLFKKRNLPEPQISMLNLEKMRNYGHLSRYKILTTVDAINVTL